MKEEIKKEILYDLREAINILKKREKKDLEELKILSDHAIEDVALHKDLDIISITVLIYSIYKVINCLQEENYVSLMKELQNAEVALVNDDLSKYNLSIKLLYNTINRCSAKIKEHLQDVMHAARIKKGTALLQKGLSIGQAAGLMGLSNWDLQQYAAKTTVFEGHEEKVLARKRVAFAMKIFGV